MLCHRNRVMTSVTLHYRASLDDVRRIFRFGKLLTAEQLSCRPSPQEALPTAWAPGEGSRGSPAIRESKSPPEPRTGSLRFTKRSADTPPEAD